MMKRGPEGWNHLGKDTQLICGRAEVFRHKYLPLNLRLSLMTTLRLAESDQTCRNNIWEANQIFTWRENQLWSNSKSLSNQTPKQRSPKANNQKHCMLDNLLLYVKTWCSRTGVPWLRIRQESMWSVSGRHQHSFLPSKMLWHLINYLFNIDQSISMVVAFRTEVYWRLKMEK